MNTLQSPTKPVTERDLQFLAYKKYQMDWFSEHGIGFDDIWRTIKDIAVTRAIMGLSDPDMNGEFDMLWQELMYEKKFDGNIFHSYLEFLHEEYKSPSYMKTILSKEEYDLYSNFTKPISPHNQGVYSLKGEVINSHLEEDKEVV